MAIDPCLDSLMVNDSPSVHIGQRLTGQTTALFFLIYPGC